MRKYLTILFAIALTCLTGHAQTKVGMAISMAPSAQFAGYYVAKEKGFFQEEGLDVTFHHMGLSSNQNYMNLIKNNTCQFMEGNLFIALEAVDLGIHPVNILQSSQTSSMIIASNGPIDDLTQIKNTNIGVWKRNDNFFERILRNDLDESNNWIPSLQVLDVFMARGMDAILGNTHTELIRLYLSTGQLKEDQILRFENTPYNFPEDGVYTTKEFYKANENTVEAFAAAVQKGWEYARKETKETVDIVMKYTREANVASNHYQQKLVLEETLRLQENVKGEATFEPISEEIFDIVTQEMRRVGMLKSSVKYEDIIPR